MINAEDVRRMHVVRSEAGHASVMLGWVVIVIVTTCGFSALAYAIGKWHGMGVCR